MHGFAKSSERTAPRLHYSPSLPNLWVPAHSHPHQAPDSPLDSPTPSPTANRAHLGPLDLAPSRVQQKSPPSSSRASPRRPPLPLTPPLTPSSLNDSASQGGLPATPTDHDVTATTIWRRKVDSFSRKGVPGSDADAFADGDVTPTDRPFVPSAQTHPQEHIYSFVSSPCLDAPPSRFLFISDVPKSISNEGIKKAFAPYNASKGIWTGHLASGGFVILAFHDLHDAETACRAVRSSKAHMLLGGVQQTIQLNARFISVAEAKKLTGNPSPVTEIEEEAAFLIQINDHSTQPSTVQSILDHFGALLAFREYHPRLGEGRWFYVEYYDVRVTQAAFQGLHDKPHVLGSQFTLYNTKTLSQPHPLTPSSPSRATLSLSMHNVVPFPTSDSPVTDEAPVARSARLRSASAEAGDGVKAFSSTGSPRASEDLRRRVTVPQDLGPDLVDHQGERRRSLSFDISQRPPDPHENAYFPDQSQFDPYAHAYSSQAASYGYGCGGAYGIQPPPQSFIPTGPSSYTPDYILPRPAYGSHTARRAAPSHSHAQSTHAHAHHSEGRSRYHAPPAHEPSEQQTDNNLNVGRIESGQDMRTTVMIKNIPNKMTDTDLKDYIDHVRERCIDFFYLRMDFQNGCNVGYAFVNFITVDDLLRFAKARLGFKWNMYASEKVLQMSYANYQGKEALVEKFKNSAIMDERESWRPKIFHSSGPDAGLPQPFPAPTHQRRKERSAHNRGALYVPGAGRLHSGDRTEERERGGRHGR